MAERKWRVRLGAAAELDIANILKWTTENFGVRELMSLSPLFAWPRVCADRSGCLQRAMASMTSLGRRLMASR
jgi:hypothetical protein